MKTKKRFNLHERFGALNSKPVFDAFHSGANALGMMLLLMVIMGLMLFGAYFGTVVWLETKLYENETKPKVNQQ